MADPRSVPDDGVPIHGPAVVIFSAMTVTHRRLKMIGQAFTMSAALGCAVLAALANPVVLASFLGLTRLPRSMVVILWLVDALLLVLAGVLVYFRKEPRFGLNVALLTGALAVGLSGAEATLRLIDFRPGALALFRRDPGDRGSFRLQPNLHFATSLADRPIVIRTNSHGMRWREVPVQATRATERIAFIGDSFTFGLWADSDSRSFVGVVDSLLAPLGLEALNFGVPGYGLLDVEMIVRDEVMAFKPAYLVLAFYNGNDLLDTYLGLDRYRVSRSGILDTDRDHIAGKIPPEFRERAERTSLVARSHLYGLLRASAKRIWPTAAEATERFVDTAKVDRSYGSNVFWSRTDYPPFADTARAMTLAALARLADLSQKSGVRFVIVTIPSVEQVYLPMAFGAGYDIDRPQRIIAEFAKARNIDFLDLLPVLTASAAHGLKPYVRHEGHFSNEGHRIVGEEIAAFLRSRSATPQ